MTGARRTSACCFLPTALPSAWRRGAFHPTTTLPSKRDGLIHPCTSTFRWIVKMGETARVERALVDKYAKDISRAEALVREWEFTIPKGTAAMARERGVDMGLLSEAYGKVIAESVRENVGGNLDEEAFFREFQAAGDGNEKFGVAGLVFEMWMGEMKGGAGGAGGGMKEGELEVMSGMYGAVLGRSVRMMGFEWEFGRLVEGMRRWMRGEGGSVVMGQEEYGRMFDIVGDCAATVMGTGNLENAERFFEMLRAERDVEDVQKDGYVLAVRGEYRNQEGNVVVGLGSVVRFWLRVWLFDGRVLLVPRFGEEDGDVETSMDQLPVSLMCAMQGMRQGESKTAFFHPYAAGEILEMLMTVDQFPPQAALIVDIFLISTT